MLKAVVEDVDRRAKPVFGEKTGDVPVGAHDDDDARVLKRARQHQRLVSGLSTRASTREPSDTTVAPGPAMRRP